MELVYLWVKEYKNIEKQGFNFSPRFECKFYDKYDADGNLENNCELVICDKEKGECLDKETKKCKPCRDNGYIKDFFGENINVTAIVGKNGSGKSSVLSSLIEATDLTYHKGLSSELNYVICYILNGNKILETNITIINKNELSFKKETEENRSQNPFILLHYDNSLSYFQRAKEKLTHGHFNPYTHTDTQIYYNNIYLFPRKDIPIDQLHKEEIKNIILYIKNSDKLIENFFEPSQIFIHPFDNSISSQYEDFKNFEFDNLKKYSIQLLSWIVDNIDSETKDKYTNTNTNILGNNSLDDIIKSLKKSTDLNKILRFIQRINLGASNVYINSLKWDIREKINSKIKKLSNYISNSLKIDNKNELFIKQDNLFQLNIDLLDDSKIDFLLSMQPFFDIYIYDNMKKVSYKDLSNGEKELLRIRFYIENIIKEKNKHCNGYLILLDEPSNSMHPNWQKMLIDYLIQTFDNREQKIHFILTTHSPFLLSDIPKQNIIFLDTYKKEDEEVKSKDQEVGNCRVLNHDEVLAKKQTFGANIHTLLSDSFFMKDGLMGEFATRKINEIIKNLKSDENYSPSKKEKRQIYLTIESIGEPFLKQKLLDIYDRKFIKEYKDRQKEKIKKQIEDLNDKLKELDND